MDQYEHGLPMREANLLATRLQLKNDGNEKTQKVSRALQLLPSKLELMSNLSTFSLYVTPAQREGGPTGFFLLRRQSYDIVRNLPPRLKSHEIDTWCRDQLQLGDGDYHICPLIASRPQQLEHLRMRLNRMCGAMLAPSKNIRTITVSTINAQRIPCNRVCGRTERENTVDNHALSDWPEYERHMVTQARIEIVMSARDIVAESPKLSQLQFLDFYEADGSHRTDTLDSISVFDTLGNRTTQYPMSCVDQGCGPSNLYYDRVCLRYIDEVGQEIDRVGSISVVEELVEGPAWLSTATGLSLPASIKTLLEDRRHEWDVKIPCLTRGE